MKKIRIILWVLFPVALIVQACLVYFGVPISFLAANAYITLTFLLPVVAMLLQTVENKDKNLSNGYYIIKLTAVALLFAMVIFFFISTLIAVS